MDLKITEKLKDRSFVEKLMGFGTPDEVKSFFKSEGLEISDDEIKEMGSSISESLTSFQNIPDSELEVSGGFGPSDVIGWVGYQIGGRPGSAVQSAPLYSKLKEMRMSGDPDEPTVQVGSEDYFKEGISGKIGKALFVHRKGLTTATELAAVALALYAGYKKGWPALKALGQSKGWWK